MYRVMIVEDEVIVREWLKRRVNWEACGFVVCAEAGNGRDALAACERETPDLILTDLRMPVMDGITLLRTVREQNKRTRFLILTCLDEFSLVRQALELDVTSYILKLTSEPDEIEEKLLKAYEALKEIDGDSAPVHEASRPEKKDEGQGINQRFSAARTYLEKHYTENISLLQVADEVGVTPNYLGKMFLKYLGCTFTDELNRLRVEQAKRLLDDPSNRIYEVAEKTGFLNTTYFFRVFKKYEGCTPTEYRARGSE